MSNFSAMQMPHSKEQVLSSVERLPLTLSSCQKAMASGMTTAAQQQLPSVTPAALRLPQRKTCTPVSYQRISILTLNFNTSFVGHLANVATLEYFTLTVFFSVFVERCSRVWIGCIERYTWLAVLTRTHVFLVRACFLLDPAETLVSLVSLLSGRQPVEIC